MTSVDIEHIGVPVFVIEFGSGGDLILAASNAANSAALGFRTADIVGRRVSDFIPREVAGRVDARFRECFQRRTTLHYDEDLDSDSDLGWWRTTLTPILNAAGEAERIVGVAVEITERKQLEADLANAAFEDAITGIANRRRFDLEMADAIDRAAGSGETFGLILIDLDGFKSVNDKFGHRKGDDVLRHVATLLTLATRESESVARIGGDEFALIVSARTATELRAIAVSLGRHLDRSLSVAEVEMQVGASIGAALWAPGQSAIDLFVIADSAMYADKASRRTVLLRQA